MPWRSPDSDYGLAGSVWTDNLDRGLAVAAQVRIGTFGVNQGYTMDPFAKRLRALTRP